MSLSVGLDGPDQDILVGVWHKYLTRLNSFTLAALGKRPMFEHVLYVVYWMLTASGKTNDYTEWDILAALTAPASDVRKQADTFIPNMFEPVAQAMDRILNWRDLTVGGIAR